MILSLIDEVTRGAWNLVLVIIKPILNMSSSSSIKTQFLWHFNSSSISQLINGKSRDLQKLLKSFNEKTASVFKFGIGYWYSRTSSLSINVQLVFVMHDLNEALFLNARSFCVIFICSGPNIYSSFYNNGCITIVT